MPPHRCLIALASCVASAAASLMPHRCLLALASCVALRPAGDVLQRLEYDRGLDASRFSFFFRDGQNPLKTGAPFDAPNDRVNGTERRLAYAIPEHRIAFFSYGERLVWHRERRVDRVYGSDGCGVKLGDVVAGHDRWKAHRAAAAAATMRDVRAVLDDEALFSLRRASSQADASPAAFLDAASDLGLGDSLVEALVVSNPRLVLREGLADALAERGRPLDPGLWVTEF